MVGWLIVNNLIDKLIGPVETVYIPDNRKVVKPGRKDMLKLNTMCFDFCFNKISTSFKISSNLITNR